MSFNSECCLWYDGKCGRRGDSKFSNLPITFKSNRDVRFEFESRSFAGPTLNCFVFEKIAFLHFGDRQTNKQMDSIDALSHSRCHERWLKKLWCIKLFSVAETHASYQHWL